MKVVIVEDEPLSAEKLERYLSKYSEAIEVLTILPSLEKAIPWIDKHQADVDIFFMDIQLTDGLSFEIFSKVLVEKPVIFTTAFEEFAIDAFKVNSIDYLLKPITFTDLTRAISKLKSMRAQFTRGEDLSSLAKQLGSKTYKDRFMVRIGNHIHSITSDSISYFHAEGRDVYLKTDNGKTYLIEYTLEALEELLSPKHFLRVNRSFIVHLNAITDVVVYSSRRLKLTVYPIPEKNVIVSREKVFQFKRWFGGI